MQCSSGRLTGCALFTCLCSFRFTELSSTAFGAGTVGIGIFGLASGTVFTLWTIFPIAFGISASSFGTIASRAVAVAAAIATAVAAAIAPNIVA